MKLRINSIWSPDLDPPSEGLPNDISDFHVLMQVSIAEDGKDGEEVFSFEIYSPSSLAKIESGMFLINILVMDKFDWKLIEARIEKLLRHCDSSDSWDDVVKQLSGYLAHAD